MNFNSIYFKYMLESNSNKEQVEKRVSDELSAYIDSRKDDMSTADQSKSAKLIKKISTELNPETIMDDLMALGKIVGLKNSYSRLVGTVLSIVDELEDEESTKTDIIGEPEAEPEPEIEPEENE